MFRLTVFLGTGIFLAMLIGGQDRGQLRFGLMAQPGSSEAPVALMSNSLPVTDQAIVAASFVPATPLMTAPQPAVAVAEVVDVAAPPEGRIFYVATASVNVRQGPGKDHAVVERLPRGEAVLVLVEGQLPDGWSLIRIEGDGVEGYIAARLLTE